MIAILSLSYCDSYRSTAIINNNVYKAVMIALGVMRCEVLKIHIFKCLQTKMVIWSLRTSSKKNLLELVTGMLFMGVCFFLRSVQCGSVCERVQCCEKCEYGKFKLIN